MMEMLTANEASTNIGELLLKSREAPVQITRSGKPVAVIMSAERYSLLEKERREIEEFKMRYLKEELAYSQADIENGRVEDFDAFFADLMAGI
jgi:prevent-host-death family protein